MPPARRAVFISATMSSTCHIVKLIVIKIKWHRGTPDGMGTCSLNPKQGTRSFHLKSHARSGAAKTAAICNTDVTGMCPRGCTQQRKLG